MADLARTAVTVTETWREGGTNSRKFKAQAVTLVLTGQGTTTSGERIAASLFGLNKIWSVRDCRSSTNEAIDARPSYDGSYIMLYNYTIGIGATAITDTVKLTVLGKD